MEILYVKPTMFTKFFFVAVFGCALVLASSVHEEEGSIRVARETTVEKITDWVNGVDDKIAGFFGGIGDTFSNLWRRITGKDSKEKQAKLNEIKEDYEIMKIESVQAVNAKKAEWDRIIAEHEQKLQQLRQEAGTAVENEMKAWDEKFDQLKQDAEKIINSK